MHVIDPVLTKGTYGWLGISQNLENSYLRKSLQRTACNPTKLQIPVVRSGRNSGRTSDIVQLKKVLVLTIIWKSSKIWLFYQKNSKKLSLKITTMWCIFLILYFLTLFEIFVLLAPNSTLTRTFSGCCHVFYKV